MGVVFGGQECLEPLTLWEDCRELGLPTEPWFGRANSFTCPLGVEPGTGWLLLTRGQLDRLDLNSSHSLTFTGGGTSVTLRNLHVVRAQAVTPGARDSTKTAFLAEIADRRRLLARVPIDRAYNLRCQPAGDYLTASLNSGSPWNWSGMTSNLWAAVGGLGDFPGLPFSPDGNPDGWTFWGGFALAALGLVLDRIACALRLDPTTDTFSVVRLGATDATASAALTRYDITRTWDTEPIDPAQARLPQYVRVLFRRQPTPLTGASPYYAIDVPDSGAESGYQSGGYVVVTDDLPALTNNAAALATRAVERAADWFRVARCSRRHRVYSGALAGGLLPGSQVGATTWEDRGAGVKTGIAPVRWPASAVRLDPGHRQGGGAVCEADPTGCTCEPATPGSGLGSGQSCCPNALPAQLCVSGQIGLFSSGWFFFGPVPVDYDAPQDAWIGSFVFTDPSCGSATVLITIRCGGVPLPYWSLRWEVVGQPVSTVADFVFTCSPLALDFVFYHSYFASPIGCTGLTTTVVNVTECGGSGSGGSGSGGSGSGGGYCGVYTLALGGAINGSPTSSITQSGVTVDAGDVLMVTVGVCEAGGGGGFAVNATYNGAPMTADGSQLSADGTCALYRFYLPVAADTTGDIVVTLSAGTKRMGFIATAFHGLASGIMDVETDDDESTWPPVDTGSTGATAGACELAHAVFWMRNLTGTEGTFSDGYNYTGQSMALSVGADDYVMTEAVKVLTVAVASTGTTLTSATDAEAGASWLEVWK